MTTILIKFSENITHPLFNLEDSVSKYKTTEYILWQTNIKEETGRSDWHVTHRKGIPRVIHKL